MQNKNGNKHEIKIMLSSADHNCSASQPLEEKQQDPKQKSLKVEKVFGKTAFTLIELLVVVLIIGILAVVAIPQYQTTVEKARAAEAITIVRSIGQAQRRYYMSNAEYTYEIDKLDIEVPGKDEVFQELPRKRTTFFNYGARSSSPTNLDGVIAIAQRGENSTFYSLRIYADKAGIYCRGYSDEGAKICQALSGKSQPDDGVFFVID